MGKKIVEGFKDQQKLEIFEKGLFNYNPMIFYVWKVGVNLALRVSDVLNIKIEEAREYLELGEYKSKDIKTGKRNHVKLNKNTIEAFERALDLREKNINNNKDNRFLFVGMGNRSYSYPKSMTRQTVDRAFKYIVDNENLKIDVGTHTMRKTWGYMAYKKTNNIEIIMKRLNHSSPGTTMAYIGITNREVDELVEELNI
ncbi:tyrosine-type recombinase/integrase [Cetobacterium sp. SF1]|uniref:tyrosine-type recombinase/integrase n=1 Tax=unclassified Cetobacterium TaxID=2630983 RepID=UPI003CEDBD30